MSKTPILRDGGFDFDILPLNLVRDGVIFNKSNQSEFPY